ncbi:MAG: PqqD family protein [Actinomycetota bacterium]
MQHTPEARPVARRDDLLVEALEGELVAYDLLTHQVSCLNATAALVWKLSDGSRTVDHLAAELAAETRLPRDPELVLLCLSRLQAANLLKPASALPNVTRRQVIQRLALTTSLAALLPVVTTVRAEAQTNLASCVHRSQCVLPQNQCSPCYQGANLNENQCRSRRCHNGSCRPQGQTPCP